MTSKRFRARVETNIQGLRLLQFQEDLGEGSSKDTLTLMTNPSNNPRDLLIGIDGPGGAIRGQISLTLQQASTLKDWLEYVVLGEPARLDFKAGDDEGKIADGTRIMDGSQNLTNLVDHRGMRTVFEVGPPPNQVQFSNGVLVGRVNTDPIQEAS